MTTKSKVKDDDNKVYLIEHDDGIKRKITIPADWRVTFGPAAAGQSRGIGTPKFKMPMALRFYENETQQRAIFTDVKSFRDTSIPIEEERVTIENKVGTMDVDGANRSVHFEARIKSWVNPDNEDEVNAPALAIGDDLDI